MTILMIHESEKKMCRLFSIKTKPDTRKQYDVYLVSKAEQSIELLLVECNKKCHLLNRVKFEV